MTSQRQETFPRQLFLNFKGGTGKTTLSAAYGLQLAEQGRRVLFLDLDPQGHLTKCLGINEWQFDRTLYHALVRDVPITELMKKIPGLPESTIVPADISLSTTDLSLSGLPYREWRLVHALSAVKKQFDVVVMDAPPAISLLNLNAILACTDLVIPVLPDSLSVFGLKTLLRTVGSIETDFDHRIGNVRILINKFAPEDPASQESRDFIRKHHKGQLLETVIRHSAHLSRQPLLHRFGARLVLDERSAEDIESLVEEIGPLLKPKPKASAKRSKKA